MHPIEKLGWSVCADAMTVEERQERVSVLEGVRDSLRETAQRRLLCHVQMCLAVHETFCGDPDAARPLLDEALALADPETDRIQFLSVLQTEGTYWLHVGKPARAVEACITMVREADADDMPWSLRIKSRLNLAYALTCLGEFEGARRYCEEASALAEQTGAARRLGEVAAVSLILVLDAGNVEEATQLWMRSRDLLEGDVDARARALFKLAEARLAMEDGRLGAARRLAEEVLSANHAGVADDQLLLFTLLSRVCLESGDAAEALVWNDRAHREIPKAAHGPRIGACLSLRARVLHRLGRVEEMFAAIDQASTAWGAGSGRMLWQTLEARLDEIHHLREVELRATNEALRRMHHNEAQQRARAEAAAKARHMFLSSMSHEMRTPLTGLMGALSLIEQGVAPDQQQRLLGVARRSAGLTLQIIDDILDLGRLESGRMSLDLGAFELERPVRDVVAITRDQAAEAKVQLSTSFGPNLPGWVRGDVRRLKQVLLNLVANALKFAAGGTVCVRVDRGADGLRFEVEDDGIGIPREVQAQLFEPFIQAGPSISRGFGGTGLGLSICRAIVQAFGGTIGVDSEPGEGATFWFVIPLEEADPFVDEPTSEHGLLPTDGSLTGIQVLLVEDNQVNRELAALALEMLGAEVVVAEDGVEAVHAVQERSFDIILMDMHMPRMGGLAATRHLRAAGVDTPVVALTAAVLPEDRSAAEDAGMDGFATKPIDPPSLIEVMERAMRARTGDP